MSAASTDNLAPAQPPSTGLDQVQFAIPIPSDARRTLARGWLWLGLLALIGSGVFSVLLVLARTPGINRLLPGTDFFRVALGLPDLIIGFVFAFSKCVLAGAVSDGLD